MLILIADVDAHVRNSLADFLKADHEVTFCEDGAQVLAELEKTAADLVIAGHDLPGPPSTELIRKGRELSPPTAFFLLVAPGRMGDAVAAIQAGVEDYLVMPVQGAELEHRVRRLEDLLSFRAENSIMGVEGAGISRLTGTSLAIRGAKEFVVKVAAVPAPILLLGPRGSGKETMAHAIHETSPARTRPFASINCANLSENQLESELFGNEIEAKPGKLELARNGTLFVDEIAELPGALQGKLLRVLQEKEFFRVGGVRSIQARARLIVATHRPLGEMVKTGTFREDLFFRLNVLTFEVAPLANRSEDIIPLIEFYWNKLTRELGRKSTPSPKALQRLTGYSYPANIRELQNVLERMIILGPEKGVVQAEVLPPEFYGLKVHDQGAHGKANVGKGLTELLEDLEGRLVKDAMEQAGNNQVKAAEILKITRGALQYKLKKYSIGHHSHLEAA